MATRKLLSGLLRRSHSCHSCLPRISTVLSNLDFPPLPAAPTSSSADDALRTSRQLPFTASFRFFSSSSSKSEFLESSYSLDSHGESELRTDLLTDASVISNSNVGGDVLGDADYLAAIEVVVSLLDWIHDSTGLPWWITIAFSTLMLRMVLFPVLLLQLHKVQRIGECVRDLPLPFPLPPSRKSFIEQFSYFRKERKAIGCPTFFWFLAYLSVQGPFFFFWMLTIRNMSLDQHVGFDSGGALWFQDLTEIAPQGAPGFIFPTLIASLHLVNIQIALKSSKGGKGTGQLDLIAKLYRIYLKALAVPIFFTGFFIPHGSLVYWVSNSSLSAIQQLCLLNPDIREWLGLNRDPAFSSAIKIDPELKVSDPMGTSRKVPVKDLSPEELVVLAVQSLSKGDEDEAFPFLRLALEKDPEYVRALFLLGRALLQKQQEGEAIEYLERAISKISSSGLPTSVEEVDILLQAYQWVGAVYVRQGNPIQGRIRFERAASMEEPENPKSKVVYYNGLVFLSSALANEGRKAEAIEYLRKAVAYDPGYKVFLDQCEKDAENFVDNLVNSRRSDY